MKKLILSALFIMGLISFAYAYGIDSQTNIDTTGFPFTPVTKTDTNADDVRPYSAETDTVVWTPAAGKKIVLMGIVLTSETATAARIETGSTLVGPAFEVTASGLVVVQSSYPIWIGTDDATLTYTIESKGRHSILLNGYEID